MAPIRNGDHKDYDLWGAFASLGSRAADARFAPLVIARYRQRVDADGHLKFLQRQLPKQVFRVVFDCEHRQILEELSD